MRTLLPIVVLLCACPRTPANNTNAGAVDAGQLATSFWPWFAANEPRLASALSADPVKVMEEIQQHLTAEEPGLIAELQVMPAPGRPHGLVISAGGSSTLFPNVKRLVSRAPTLSRFEVITFRPRRDLELDLELDGRKFSPDDFKFRQTARREGKLDIELAIAGLRPENRDDLMRAAFLLLDAAVGEYDVETKIGNIDFTPAGSPDAGHRPLSDLPASVDALK